MYFPDHETRDFIIFAIAIWNWYSNWKKGRDDKVFRDQVQAWKFNAMWKDYAENHKVPTNGLGGH